MFLSSAPAGTNLVQTLLRGEIDYVCIEISTGRPQRFPPRFKDVYVVEESVARELSATD